MSPWRAHWTAAEGACSVRMGPRTPVLYDNRHSGWAPHARVRAELHPVPTLWVTQKPLATWSFTFSVHGVRTSAIPVSCHC